MKIDKPCRDQNDMSFLVTVVGDNFEIDAKLPRSLLDDEILDGANDAEVASFIDDNSEDIMKAAIAAARASIAKIEAEQLPYFAFARRPFDSVRFLAIRWEK